MKSETRLADDDSVGAQGRVQIAEELAYKHAQYSATEKESVIVRNLVDIS